MLCELTGTPAGRVEALLRDCGSAGFASLCRHAGLPDELLPAFRAAVRAAADAGANDRTALSLAAVERVIASCDRINGSGAFDRLIVMLRRFEAEAARDEARKRREMLAASQGTAGEPLLLCDFDGGDPHRAASGRELDRRPRYAIDLAAIEAQLCAA